MPRSRARGRRAATVAWYVATTTGAVVDGPAPQPARNRTPRSRESEGAPKQACSLDSSLKLGGEGQGASRCHDGASTRPFGSPE